MAERELMSENKAESGAEVKTFRDEIAIEIMKLFVVEGLKDLHAFSVMDAPKVAYRFADAMLEARKK